jgi:hypothetical protein
MSEAMTKTIKIACIIVVLVLPGLWFFYILVNHIQELNTDAFTKLLGELTFSLKLRFVFIVIVSLMCFAILMKLAIIPLKTGGVEAAITWLVVLALILAAKCHIRVQRRMPSDRR